MKHPVVAIIPNLTEENETETGRGLILYNHVIILEKKTDDTIKMDANYDPTVQVPEIVIAFVERSTDEYKPYKEGRNKSANDERSESSGDSKPDSVKGNIRRGSKKGGKKA